VTGRPDVPVVPLREAAALLGLTTRAAESALRHAAIRSGYPREAVEWLRDNRPGRGARTDIQPVPVRTCLQCGGPGPTEDFCDACVEAGATTEIPQD